MKTGSIKLRNKMALDKFDFKLTSTSAQPFGPGALGLLQIKIFRTRWYLRGIYSRKKRNEAIMTLDNRFLAKSELANHAF